ncbi:DNA-protecting protein DprA [Sneathiella sp. P13V-1]|uniref:DNA-processing protein DprA n=1 Tax=Sneathiella sp. P13V-1 TaxID=2697366 RepID=UPI00187B188B|nr:DNA-protecting protein DprA [Sneathiella sp. P13V-1]
MRGQQNISNEERLSWLQLIRSENVGPVTFYHLLQKFGSAQKALQKVPELAKRGGAKRPIQIFSRSSALHELERLEEIGGRLVASCDPEYPPLLREIHDPPPVISILGHPSLLQRRSLGIVGSRNASAAAIRLTRQFAEEIGKKGISITSGLARGIDAAAHIASLETGTVGVVGGGVDVIYPQENKDLHHEIAARGCIIAEQPLGTQPQARHFPRRNRIISGISLGILVMEATPKSGSLITARMAAEHGREVFAIPGSPLDPRARGTNNLIRQGAMLVETPAELLESLNQLFSQPFREPEQPELNFGIQPDIPEQELESARPHIMSLLSPVAVEIDEIIRLTGIAPALVMTILLELELAGRVERHFGNRVSLVS